MNIEFKSVDLKDWDELDRKDFRNFLALGVKDTAVVFSGNAWKWMPETAEQLIAFQTIYYRLMPDEHLGSIEVYADGSFNVFLKQDSNVTGAWTYRSEK